MAQIKGAQLSLADESDEYRAFVEKFKPNKTTDDCYTPPAIYATVLTWVVKRYGIDPLKVVRPFWPGKDYESMDYPEDCVVVDNPPFSILSKICTTYTDNDIKFFLFAPMLTLLGASGRKNILKHNHIATHTIITYENSAKVPTSFVTNLDTDGTVLESAPDLGDLINEVDAKLQRANKRNLPKYTYPDHVMTAAKANYFASHQTPYKLNAKDCVPISKLDAMEQNIFGGGLLLSERAAAERAAAERAAAERAAAIKWQLSERELAIVDMLGSDQLGLG